MARLEQQHEGEKRLKILRLYGLGKGGCDAADLFLLVGEPPVAQPWADPEILREFEPFRQIELPSRPSTQGAAGRFSLGGR